MKLTLEELTKLECLTGELCSTRKDCHCSNCKDYREGVKGRWHGSSSAGTNQHCFWYSKENESDFHVQQFQAIWDKLHELVNTKDGNGDSVVELAYTRPLHRNPVVAYRFTSDWAYHQYNGALTHLGSSLGRGIWDPLKDTYWFDMFLAD